MGIFLSLFLLFLLVIFHLACISGVEHSFTSSFFLRCVSKKRWPSNIFYVVWILITNSKNRSLQPNTRVEKNKKKLNLLLWHFPEKPFGHEEKGKKSLSINQTIVVCWDKNANDIQSQTHMQIAKEQMLNEWKNIWILDERKKKSRSFGPKIALRILANTFRIIYVMDWFRIRNFAHSLKYLRKGKSTTHRLNATHTHTNSRTVFCSTERECSLFSRWKMKQWKLRLDKKKTFFFCFYSQYFQCGVQHTSNKHNIHIFSRSFICVCVVTKKNTKNIFQFCHFHLNRKTIFKDFPIFYFIFPFWYVVLLIIFTNTALRLPYEIFFCARRSLLEWKTRTNRMRRRREEKQKKTPTFFLIQFRI